MFNRCNLRRKQRREQQINEFVRNETYVDFGGQSTRNTLILKEHCVTDDIVEKYEKNEAILTQLQTSCKSPLTSKCSSVAYKIALAEKVDSAMTQQNLSSKSLETCGATKKATSNRFRTASKTAALMLAHRIYLQRQSCINKLKFCSYYLKDMATATLAVMKLSKTDEEKKLAVLGLQCHSKASEPFFPAASYSNGSKYNFRHVYITCSLQF